MTTATHAVGIDVSKAKVDVCVLEAGTAKHKPQHSVFENNRQGFRSLANYLKKRVPSGTGVCLEATGAYGDEVAAYLHQRGYAVKVVNPIRIKRYAQSQMTRNKTDKQDAYYIADFCLTQSAPLWTPPDPSWVELRDLVRHMDNLIEIQVQQRLRLQSAKSRPVQADLEAHIAYLDDQIEAVKKRIKDHIDQHPTLKQQQDLLNSITGIADQTSSRLLAEIRQIDVFDSVEQLVAYAGLNPQRRQSGKYCGQIKISKQGNARLRRALFMAGKTALRHNRLVQPLVARMKRQNYAYKAIVVAVMRKLLHYAYGVLKSGQPFDPDYLNRKAANA
jgi:transposase